jgi:hypothetical protein
MINDLGEGMGNGCGLIGRAIINYNDLEIGVAQIKAAGNRSI